MDLILRSDSLDTRGLSNRSTGNWEDVREPLVSMVLWVPETTLYSQSGPN